MNESVGYFRKRLSQVSIPWVFDRHVVKNVVIRSGPANKANLIGGITSMIMQMVKHYPPGHVRFLMIDPVGLGQNFSAFHALADHDDKLISSKVWSNKSQIADQLDLLVEHIEAVVQKYLRADYENIDEYNHHAGEIAEPFRFVFIQDFPENFDKESVLALERIMTNGPRCGVHVFLSWDVEKELPYGVKMDVLLKTADQLEFQDGALRMGASPSTNLSALFFHMDKAQNAAVISDIVTEHGRYAADGARVKVPYEKMMQRVFAEEHGYLRNVRAGWQMKNSDLLAIPLGPAGARKIQLLVLGGKGTTAHHVLLVGKTGAGKSNLLHVLIMSLAELYSPDDLSVMLMDFKKGVEFKDYATFRLPHASVVAIESEIEFGLSVLRGLDSELTQRGDLFRQNAVQELSGFREKTGDKMARVLVIVDEFHELFAEEGAESREALAIIERIVRQGRSFGIHLVLASQSIAGIHLPRAILDQIGVRIVMQCSDADARTILADDNTGARLLDHAGEAIYNDKNGLIEANNIFQVALMDPSDRVARLKALYAKMVETYSGDQKIIRGPFVFEGSEPVKLSDCRALIDLVGTWPPKDRVKSLKVWVGEPIAMLPTHSIPLKPQSGANLLIVDRDEQLAFGVMQGLLLSILAQETPETVLIHFVNLAAADSDWVEYPDFFANSFPHPFVCYPRREIASLLVGLAEGVDKRLNHENRSRPRIFLVIFGIQRARDLRLRDTFSFSAGEEQDAEHDHLERILRDGPEVGVHTLIWCDTLQSVGKILNGQEMNEVGLRISGPLSAGDSVKFFDDPVASKLNRDNRMLCYDDDRIGAYTQIRPFLPTSKGWLEELGKTYRKLWRSRKKG